MNFDCGSRMNCSSCLADVDLESCLWSSRSTACVSYNACDPIAQECASACDCSDIATTTVLSPLLVLIAMLASAVYLRYRLRQVEPLSYDYHFVRSRGMMIILAMSQAGGLVITSVLSAHCTQAYIVAGMASFSVGFLIQIHALFTLRFPRFHKLPADTNHRVGVLMLIIEIVTTTAYISGGAAPKFLTAILTLALFLVTCVDLSELKKSEKLLPKSVHRSEFFRWSYVVGLVQAIFLSVFLIVILPDQNFGAGELFNSYLVAVLLALTAVLNNESARLALMVAPWRVPFLPDLPPLLFKSKNKFPFIFRRPLLDEKRERNNCEEIDISENLSTFLASMNLGLGEEVEGLMAFSPLSSLVSLSLFLWSAFGLSRCHDPSSTLHILCAAPSPAGPKWEIVLSLMLISALGVLARCCLLHLSLSAVRAEENLKNENNFSAVSTTSVELPLPPLSPPENSNFTAENDIEILNRPLLSGPHIKLPLAKFWRWIRTWVGRQILCGGNLLLSFLYFSFSAVVGQYKSEYSRYLVGGCVCVSATGVCVCVWTVFTRLETWRDFFLSSKLGISKFKILPSDDSSRVASLTKGCLLALKVLLISSTLETNTHIIFRIILFFLFGLSLLATAVISVVDCVCVWKNPQIIGESGVRRPKVFISSYAFSVIWAQIGALILLAQAEFPSVLNLAGKNNSDFFPRVAPILALMSSGVVILMYMNNEIARFLEHQIKILKSPTPPTHDGNVSEANATGYYVSAVIGASRSANGISALSPLLATVSLGIGAAYPGIAFIVKISPATILGTIWSALTLVVAFILPISLGFKPIK